MNKHEYTKQHKLIIEQFGSPEFANDGVTPSNESAKRLIVLKQAYDESNAKAKQLKKLEIEARENEESLGNIEIPEYLVRPEWLLSFKEHELPVVAQYLTNVRQSPKQIAVAIGKPLSAVQAVMRLEAFTLLNEHLSNAYVSSKKLEVAASLVSMLTAKTESVRLKAAELLAYEFGIIKHTSNPEDKAMPVLDAETLAKYSKLADEIRKRDNA